MQTKTKTGVDSWAPLYLRGPGPGEVRLRRITSAETWSGACSRHVVGGGTRLPKLAPFLPHCGLPVPKPPWQGFLKHCSNDYLLNA